jgi:hypothetical protein
MTMTYNSLVANKGTAGAIANFLSYAKLTSEIPTILDEAQGLLFTLLRTREMRTKTRFLMPQGNSVQVLPVRFLDPISRMFTPDWNIPLDHKDESFLSQNRNYTPLTGTLGTNPFTTVNGSNTVTVNLTNHGFNQESAFYTTGATTFAGMTVPIAGTFDVTSIVDVNNFTIDITLLGSTPTSSVAGGGAAITYQVDILIQGTPRWWAIWDEAMHFDVAFSQPIICELMYFQSLPLLSSTNQSNFITNRYPHLLRPACQAQAAAFMRDDATYQREVTRLTAITQAVNAENDMLYRGMVLDTDIP